MATRNSQTPLPLAERQGEGRGACLATLPELFPLENEGFEFAARVRRRHLPALGARLFAALAAALGGCSSPGPVYPTSSAPSSSPSSAPAGQPVVYDTTAPKRIEPRDWLERHALERGPDLRLIDALLDERTRVPEFSRQPLADYAPEAPIGGAAALLPDTQPFAEPPPLEPKDVSIRVAVARSTFRTRTREEVLSAVQPFVDLVQREVDIRGAPVLYETPSELYYGLIDGQVQMAVAHVFDYLLIRSWVANDPANATVPLARALPANPRVTDLDRDMAGVEGTCIEIVVAHDAPLSTFADLRGKRLALAANYVNAPGAFLAGLLAEAGAATDQPYFAGVTLRAYSKDAVLDVLKGKADAACVDQGTIAALDRFYGLAGRLRTIAISPRYNVDVLFTTLNNLATHQTEIELTQTQLTTLGKDPEGQEVLFFFDTQRWENYRAGFLDVPLEHFAQFVKFMTAPPAELQPLLDPQAAVDRRTYNRYGDE